MSHYIDSMVVEGGLTHKSWNTNVLVTTVSAGTQNLTVDSETMQVYQGGTSGQIVKMPSCSTFSQIGQRYMLHNDSTQNITVQDNNAGALFLLAPGERASLVCTDVGSAAGAWSYWITYKTPQGEQFLVTYTGSLLAVNYTGGVARFNGVTTLVAGGALSVPGSTTNGWIYVDLDGAVKANASLPDGAMPMAKFTSTTTITALVDEREVVDQNTLWGVQTDIQPITKSNAQGAGSLEKAARADHVHASTLPLYKAGQLANTAFGAGNPRTAAVAFNVLTPMPDTAYSVVVTGTDGRSWKITNVLTTGFTINTQSSTALTGPVYWVAIHTGESV